MGAVGVAGGEEAGTGAGGVEDGELGGGDGGDGVAAGFEGRTGWGDDWDAAESFFETCFSVSIGPGPVDGSSGIRFCLIACDGRKPGEGGG